MFDYGRRDSGATASSVEYGRPDQRRDKWKERLNTELLKAVSSRQLDRVRRLLEQGASAEARCRKSWVSACHLAALAEDSVILELLVNIKKDVLQVRDRQGRQPHHLAAATGNLTTLHAILGMDPSLVDSQIQPLTPNTTLPVDILDSWNHNHNEFVCMVPEAAGIGRTALHLASDRGFSHIIWYLLSVNASPNIQDTNGLTPLDVVGQNFTDLRPIQTEPPDIKSKKTASRSGAKFSALTSRSLLETTESTTVEEEKTDSGDTLEEVCTLLIKGGAELHRTKVIVKDGVVINQRRMNVTALHTAVLKENVKLTTYLLEKGACPLTWNGDGHTAVHVAVKIKSEQLLRVLIASDRCVVIEARDVQGRTPLLQAVQEGWSDGVALLLEAGAQVTITSNTNQTVLHLAAQNGWVSILEELLSIKETHKILDRTNLTHETPLCLAVKFKQLECVKLLCQNHADSNFLLLPGDQSLLHIAVQNNSVEILQCLLANEGRSRIDLLTKEEKGGLTPLHIAAAEGYLECAEELIAHGTSVKLKTKGEETALHLAARNGKAELVRLLVKEDSSTLESRNKDGWNPLHVAAAEGNTECVRQMVLNGGDLSSSVEFETKKKTAIDIICTSIPKPVEFLEEVFNDFIEVIRGPMNDPNCEVLLSYDPLMPNGEDEKQLTVISAILNTGRQTLQDRLMLHPLIETFLYLKWNKFKYFSLFIMILYFIMTISVTLLAHLTFVEKTNSNVLYFIAIISRVVLCTVLIPIIVVEIVHLSQLQRHYFTDYESWVKWTVIVFTCIVESVSPSVFWVRYISAVTVLLAWIELLFLLSRSPAWGFYVLMFARVAIKITKILATFSFLIIGFAISFLILFEANIPFRNILESIIKVIVMMIEFDYEDMFNSQEHADTFSVVGRLMFATFVLLVAMVMMNLIVGVAVSDIARLEEQGRTQQLAKQASFLSFLEALFYSGRLKGLPKSWKGVLQHRRMVPRTLVLQPGKPSSYQGTLLTSHIDGIMFNVKTRSIRDTHISESLQNITNGIDRVSEVLKDFYTNHQKAHVLKYDKEFERMLTLILDEQRAIRDQIAISKEKEYTTPLISWEHKQENYPIMRC